jgi:LmbE family N-acetylglucosaminyl deacetylase
MSEFITENEYLKAICSEGKGNVELPHTVIISAHPDDEIVGAGGILRRLGKISFIHVTDGSPKDLSDAFKAGFGSRDGYAKARKLELKEAIKFADINPEHFWEIGLVDQEASFNMAGLAIRIAQLLEKVLPCVVLTHAYEGGHPDHDATAFST